MAKRSDSVGTGDTRLLPAKHRWATGELSQALEPRSVTDGALQDPVFAGLGLCILHICGCKSFRKQIPRLRLPRPGKPMGKRSIQATTTFHLCWAPGLKSGSE